MKVFVTGGTGFIGARLTEKLIGDNHEVTLLARNPSMVPYAGNEKVTIVKGDLSDRGILKKGMKSCDWVFHMAAYAKPTFRDPSVVTAINIDGTVNVLEAALESGVRKVVFTSTGGTMSYSHDGMTVDEETNKDPELHTLYEKTKAEAEKIAVDYTARGLDVVIVNPTRVYGPGRLSESNSVTRIIKLYMLGLWRINPGDGNSIGNYVYVDDVAEGHILAAMRGRGGERYILGGENHSFNSLFDTIGSMAGKKRTLIRLPAGLMKAIVRGITFFSGLFRVSPPITRDFLDKYLRDWIMSSDKAVSELGYGITPLSEGISKTIEWLKTVNDGKGK
ncbi:MAG: NAD-dependent epimerase/dehydratase family protein [Bacteroidales bacterium]|nr:NAD-dependent epimerase/dehydratase family protein [Bacteroidales bacterium]